jgi:hypothetical protein
LEACKKLPKRPLKGLLKAFKKGFEGPLKGPEGLWKASKRPLKGLLEVFKRLFKRTLKGL